MHMKISFPPCGASWAPASTSQQWSSLLWCQNSFISRLVRIAAGTSRSAGVLQKSRVPEITSYIVDNPDDYIFSALTASFPGEAKFTPLSPKAPNIGELEIPMSAELILNDGQHRRAAIEEALRQNPSLGEHSIAVVLFPCEDLDRMQQMFSDLNRTARSTAKSLNILFNHRDLLAQVTLTVSETVDVFRDFVDKDRASLPKRSPSCLRCRPCMMRLLHLLEQFPKTTRNRKKLSLQSIGEQSRLTSFSGNVCVMAT